MCSCGILLNTKGKTINDTLSANKKADRKPFKIALRLGNADVLMTP